MRTTNSLALLLFGALISSVALAQQQKAEPPSVGVISARLVKMAPKSVLPGTVVSRNDSQLASEVEGRVASVADVGDGAKVTVEVSRA